MKVKISVAKVIDSLEKKLATLEADYASQEEKEAKYQESVNKWKKELFAYALDNISKAENVRTNYRAWNTTLNVDFDMPAKEGQFPAEPVREFQTIHAHVYNSDKEEIEGALRMLKMCEDEYVSASLLKSISRYL